MKSLTLISAPLFIPFAIAALIGMAFTFFVPRGKRPPYLILLFLFSLVQIFWRFSLDALSKRYFIALIFPALFFSAFACVRFCDAINNFPVLKKVSCLLRWIIPSGLIVSCFVALFHYNPYNECPIKIAECIENDAKSLPCTARVVCTAETFKNRICYYLSRDACDLSFDPVVYNGSLDRDEMIGIVKLFRSETVPLYFIIQRPSSQTQISADEVSVPVHSWARIYSTFSSRNKKRTVEVYRMFPYNLQRHSPAMVGNLLPNGDFSKISRRTLVSLENAGFRFFRKAVDMADDWTVTTPWSKSSLDSEFEFVSQGADPAMRIKSSCRFTVCNRKHFDVSNYLLRFSVQSRTDSLLHVSVHTYDASSRAHSFFNLAVFNLGPMRSAETYQVLLKQSDFPKEVKDFILCFKLEHGEVFIHSAELYHIQDIDNFMPDFWPEFDTSPSKRTDKSASCVSGSE